MFFVSLIGVASLWAVITNISDTISVSVRLFRIRIKRTIIPLVNCSGKQQSVLALNKQCTKLAVYSIDHSTTPCSSSPIPSLSSSISQESPVPSSSLSRWSGFDIHGQLSHTSPTLSCSKSLWSSFAINAQLSCVHKTVGHSTQFGPRWFLVLVNMLRNEDD